MNRPVRSMLALIVGFAAATAVFRAANPNEDSNAAPILLDDLDLFAYCRVSYGPKASAVLTGQGAYAWRCSGRPNDVFQLYKIDFDEACRALYVPSTFARTWDDTNPHSWECFSGDD